jgi:serine/threonine-protein kinase
MRIASTSDPTTTTASASASASSSAPEAASTAVTDLPDPPTANAEALAEYRAAMQGFRDGVGSFDARLKRVVERDPKIAASWLRIAYFTFQLSPTDARAAYAKAVEHRALLTERDRMLLRALEPWIVWQPPNLDERQRRFDEMYRRYPGDAEISFYVAGVSRSNWLSEEHLAPLDRAVVIDPKFANAWWQLGQQHAYLGDLSRARAALDRCLDISGAATACLWNRIVIDEVEGRCEAVESDARRWTTVDASDPLGWYALGAALYARGRPITAVEEALRKAENLIPAADRPREAETNAIRIAFAQGDFAAVEKHARALDAIVDAAAGEPEHQTSARAMVDALVESGRVTEAARYAGRYLQRRELWAPDSFAEDFAVANDVVLKMLLVQRKAGSIDGATFDRRRDEWVSSWQRRLQGKAGAYALLHGWAATAETKDDATRGVEALGSMPLPAFAPKTMGPSFIGHTYLLAGRNAEALPLLERGAASCQALDLPYPYVRTLLWVGQAREANGDKAGACRAYASVVERWGKARPRSITADEARARMTALRCTP